MELLVQLETYLGSATRPVLGIVLLLVVVYIGRKVWVFIAGAEERALLRELKQATDDGDLVAVGEVQMKRGKFPEAARVFERAGEPRRAGLALLKTGNELGAAEAFEKAGDFSRAATLFRKLGKCDRELVCLEQIDDDDSKRALAEALLENKEYLRAGRLFQDLEEYERAADAFAKADDHESFEMALTMLENAALSMKDNTDRAKGLWKRAGELASKQGAHERAARAFDEAGEFLKAADIYEHALKKFDLAAALYGEGGDDEGKTRLTLKAGGAANVKAREDERARGKGKGKFAPPPRREQRDARAEEGDDPYRTEADSALQREEGNGAARVTAPTVRQTKKQGTPEQLDRESARAPDMRHRFELLAELGRGGMGVVHKARDKELNRLVALKFLPEELAGNATVVSMFQREARAAAALTHPGIVTIHDVGMFDGRPFIAMEFVKGDTLDRVLEKEGPLSAAEAIPLFVETCEAIQYAHENSVIHRDIKPSNLMRTPKGAKVMDFGLAKVVGATAPMKSVVAGTPAYMAPEQLAGAADHRSDIFSLGATFYELLTGKVPGERGKTAAMMVDYPTVREHKPNTPARLSDLVARCLDHEPSMRPQDAFSLRAELQEIRGQMDAVSDELKAFLESSPPKRSRPR